MKLGVFIVWATALVASVVAVSIPEYQLRDRPRSIRGFKNVALSTARGFGKRAETYTTSLDALQFPDRDSFPADWFADELQNNSDLARLVVHKFIDTNQDGELTADELLRPLYASSSAADKQSVYK